MIGLIIGGIMFALAFALLPVMYQLKKIDAENEEIFIKKMRKSQSECLEILDRIKDGE